MLKLVWYVLYWYSSEWLLYHIQFTLIQYLNIDLKCYFRYVIFLYLEETDTPGGITLMGKITGVKKYTLKTKVRWCSGSVVLNVVVRQIVLFPLPPLRVMRPRRARHVTAGITEALCLHPLVPPTNPSHANHPRRRPIPTRHIVRNFTVKQEIWSEKFSMEEY